MRRHAGDLFVLGAATVIFVAQQLAISFFPLDGAPGTMRRALFLVTTAALALMALQFRRFFGAWLVTAGIVMNLLPMAAHGGAMPIDFTILERSRAFPDVTEADIGRQTNHGKDVVLRREDIHFYWLSDRFIVDLPLYGTNIYSAGDFVLFAGLGLVAVQAAVIAVRPGARKAAAPGGFQGSEGPATPGGQGARVPRRLAADAGHTLQHPDAGDLASPQAREDVRGGAAGARETDHL